MKKETIKEYIVPFNVEGQFRLRAKNIADLKKKMDGMMIGDLMSTSENIELKAYPDRAEKVATIKQKNPIDVKIIK